jgi:hypothetical protein
MRSVGILVDPPVFDDDPGFAQGVEAPGVEQFIAQPPVERLDPSVLPGRSGIDEQGSGAVEPAPVIHDIAIAFGCCRLH